MHLYLGFTWKVEADNWSLYILLALAQILIALAIRERLPMALAGISLLIIAEKVSRFASEKAYQVFAGRPAVDRMAAAVRLVALASQGALILLIAIAYVAHRKSIDRVIRQHKMRLLG